MRVRSFIASLCLLVAFAAIPAQAEAQIQSRAAGSRFWVDVNFGVNIHAQSETTFTFDYGQEWPDNPAHTIIGATYDKPSTAVPFDIGGGYMFTNRFGVGASWTRYSMEDPATLTADVPDFEAGFPNGFGTAQSDPLKRTESMFNISAMFVIAQNDRMELRAYAGPSFFSLDSTMIFDISWTQTFNPDGSDVAIVDYETREATGSGIGFHAGADFAWMFTRNFGVGAGFRWAQGKVDLEPEPLSETNQELTVGGVQVLFGARFRFGRR
jgi:hypothetical protein